jgi:hypothetical protein
LERLLQEKIIHKIQRDKTKIKFKKIKEYSEIEKNEKTDKRAKEKLEEEITYKDLEEYKNKTSIYHNGKEIQSNYKRT